MRVGQAGEKVEVRSPEDSPNAVVKAVADDMDWHPVCRADVKQSRETWIDANLVQQAVDLLPGRGHQRHLGGQAFPRTDLTAQPGILNLQPRRIRERPTCSAVSCSRRRPFPARFRR